MALDLRSLLRSGGTRRGRAGTEDRRRRTLYTTPWAWRTNDGIYVGLNREAWVYASLPVAPLTWEDPSTQLARGQALGNLLADLGATSQDVGGSGLATLARTREVHVVSLTWDDVPSVPEGTPEALASFLSETLNFLAPRRVLLVGVKLRASTLDTTRQTRAGVLTVIKTLLTRSIGEDAPDLALGVYEADLAQIRDTFSRHDAVTPDETTLAHLESWYNDGRGTDAPIYEARDALYVESDNATIELATVTRFDQDVLTAPYDPWILDALTHPEAPCVVSVRAELTPSTIVRAQMRRGQRRMIAQIEEEAQTGDLERVEQSGVLRLAKAIEDHVATTREAWLTNASIIMARRSRDAVETYLDELRSARGIHAKPLEHRQLDALHETLPCADVRVNPFPHVLSISALAHSGIQGYSGLGDAKGAYVGVADPDLTPSFLDFLAAPADNSVPVTGVFGDPGSGKTFLCQLIAVQAALAGLPVIFINPKGHQTLKPFADLVGGSTVVVSQLEEEGGFYDPFLYAETPAIAAEMLTSHILAVLGHNGSGQGFTQEQELSLTSGLMRGALAGARCAAEALEYVTDETVRSQVLQQVEASSTFALGFGMKPRMRYSGTRGLTLIEFDRELEFPEKGVDPRAYTRPQRISIAAMRLVTRAAIEILVLAKGGVLIVDEAWSFLSSSEGRSALQTIGRKGRSWNILPIFATQRIADLLESGVDMESFMSRVFVMKLADPVEAAAALRLCGLEATPARIAWLKSVHPHRRKSTGQVVPARALHRDLYNRHAALSITPVPPAVIEAFSTNPVDTAERDAEDGDDDSTGA